LILLNNIKWINYQGVLVPDELPDKEISLTRQEMNYLLKKSGTYFLRWETDFDCGYETEYWHIIKDNVSTLESLSRYTRHNIRRGLKRCIIKKVSADVVATQGYDCYISAFRKYDTFIKPESETEFVDKITEKENNPEWEFWGVWNSDQKMIAYGINRIKENRCIYITSKFHPDHLKLYPSDALFYVMNTHYLEQRGMQYIDNGPRSLSHQTNIQDYFINKFNFRKAFSRMHIAYNARIKLAVTALFPFRKIVEKSKSAAARKLTVLLRHEEIRRSFE
jgi:hypothetical protein